LITLVVEGSGLRDAIGVTIGRSIDGDQRLQVVITISTTEMLMLIDGINLVGKMRYRKRYKFP